MRGTLTAIMLSYVAYLCGGCGEAVYVYSPPTAGPSPRRLGRIPPGTPPRVPEPSAAPAVRQAHDGHVLSSSKDAPAVTEDRAGDAAAPGEEAVVATVNGQPLTRGDLVEELMVRHGRAVLEDLIRMKAVEQEVARAGVRIKDEEIENELARERRAFRMKPGEHATFEGMIRKRYGMSMEGYRGIVRRGLLIRKMILRRENPSKDKIMLWFYQNRERYDVPAEITVSHIFVSKDDPQTGTPRPKPLVRGTLDRIRRALVRDEDFGALAGRYSDDAATRGKGGELGTVNERVAKLHLDTAFFEAMMVLKPGQAGGPVETRKGYHFIKVTARKDGRRVEYHEVRPRVQVDYREERAVILGEVFLRGLMERTRITRESETPKR